MIKPERMSKLFVVGPKSALPKVVSRLHGLKVAHIVEHKKDEFDLCAPLENFDRVSGLLVHSRALIANLNISTEGAKLESHDMRQLEKDISAIREETGLVIGKIKQAEDELHLIKEQKKLLELMAALGINPESFRKSGYIRSFFGYIGKGISRDLRSITDRFEIRTATHGKKTLAVIFVDINFSDRFFHVLTEASFSEIDAKAVSSLEGNPKELLQKLSKNQERLEHHFKEESKKLMDISKKHNHFLAQAEKFLAIEAEKAQVPLSFGSTREAFFIRCYLPEKSLEKAKQELSKAAANKLYMKEEELGNEEEIPIKLDNYSHAAPFEFFTKIFALPKYNEFDPTSLMAYTFPLFFGFMLGDVAYGAITFALFYFLKKKIPAGKDFFNIMLISSISAMIFGLLYGEFLGYEPWHGLILRTHDFNVLMMISILAGIIQVNFGLLLGFLLEYRHHGLMAAVTHKFSWVLIQFGGVLFFGPLLGMIELPGSLFYLGIIIFASGVLLLFKAESFLGVMELPSILSHIVSYARLMAVGLASVFIAVMVNNMATFLFHKGILFWPLALIALVIGHTFNIALGILSPTLHSIRLHYVEFFTKFYNGGGIEYVPFGAEKQKSIL